MTAFLGTFKPPVVATLPAAGEAGRVVLLSTTNRLYHDNGVAWVLLGVSSTGSDVTLAIVIAMQQSLFMA